jgi:broad specificity phosphatase PhoE
VIVYLVRHGEHAQVNDVLCGRSDSSPLSAGGVEQARRLAAYFADKSVGAVQSSPRQRARQTALPIAAATENAVEQVDGMDELDVSGWTGRSFESLAADPAWKAWNSNRGGTRPPGGESMTELQARVLTHLKSLQQNAEDAIVIVSHAEPIRAALMHCLGMALDRFAEIEIAPASISVIRSVGERLRADEVNLKVLP